MFDFNWLALILAAVVSFLSGMLWYSDFLFGKTWRNLMGVQSDSADMKSPSMVKLFVIAIVLDLLTAFALWNIGTAVCLTWTCLNVFAFMAWLGFMVPVMVGSVLWEGKSWKLFAINAGYRLVSVFLIAAVLARFAF